MTADQLDAYTMATSGWPEFLLSWQSIGAVHAVRECGSIDVLSLVLGAVLSRLSGLEVARLRELAMQRDVAYALMAARVAAKGPPS